MNDQDASELSWVLNDYLERGEEPPARVVSNPYSCEGQMMTETEIEEYIVESMGALKILRDRGSDKFERVKGHFLADMAFLTAIGRLDPEEYAEIIKPEVFEF